MKKRFSIPPNIIQEITQLAKIHMKRFEGDPEFGNPQISKVYPLLDTKGRKNIIFEVKFSTPEEPNHGYILLSISEEYLPVLKFAFHGPTCIERLKRNVGHWAFNPVYVTPFFLVAEDDKGDYMTALGEPPVDLRGKTENPDKKYPHRAKGKKFNYQIFKKTFLERTFPISTERQTLIKKAWRRIKKSPLIDPDDIPAHNYQTVTAKFYTSIPRYYQLHENEGANSHDFATGCGSNAWMNLVGYFDNTITPDVLRGTHAGHSPDLNGYPERIMVALSEHLGTYQGEDSPDGHGGIIDWAGLKKGYDFIKNYLKRNIGDSKTKRASGMPVLQIIYDYLCLYETPSVASIDLGDNVGHTLIVYEVKANWDDASEDHFVRVYTGNRDDSPLSFSEDPFIAFEDLYEVCALQNIQTGTEVTLPWKSLNTPAFGDLGGKLVLAFRMDTGHIGLAYSTDGKNFLLKHDIISKGTGAPSITVLPSKKYFYVAWSDQIEAGRFQLRLIKLYLNGLVQELPAPEGDSGISPAIAIHKGKLYFCWPSQTYDFATNFVCTPLDTLERTARPWPASPYAYAPPGTFWKFLPIFMILQPSLVSVGGYLYCGYVTCEGYRFRARIAAIRDSGYIDNDVDQGDCSDKTGLSICFFNRSLYGTIYSAIRWFGRSIQNPPNDIINLHSQAILFPDIETTGIKKGTVLGSYESINIGPCLLSAWINCDGYLRIRYHSEDRPNTRLDYAGWPLAGSAWPDF